MSYTLDEFVYGARASVPIPFLLCDHASHSYHLLPDGMGVRVRPRHDTLSGADLDTFRARGLQAIAYHGFARDDWTTPAAFSARLDQDDDWMAERGLVAIAHEIEEEQYWRVQEISGDPVSEMATWPEFTGVSWLDRCDMISDVFGERYGVVKSRYPAAYTLNVQPSWSTVPAPQFGGYGPYMPYVDAIGMSHYRLADGRTDNLDQLQLDLFYRDVGSRLESAKALGDAHGQALVAIMQGFTDAMWLKLPPLQYEWTYRAAMKHRAVGLMFFAVESVADITGLLDWPDLAAQSVDQVAHQKGLQT